MVLPAVSAAVVMMGCHAGGVAEPPVERAAAERRPEVAVSAVEDPERGPDTVLATVEGADILLQDLYDAFELLPPELRRRFRHEQHRLLEHVVLQQLLLHEAGSRGVGETEVYRETLRRFRASQAAEGLDERGIEDSAMVEALLQMEVAQKVEIPEEELRAVFDHYRRMRPDEDVDFEQLRPRLEHMMLQPHIEDYLLELRSGAEISLDEAWVEEKEREAGESGIR